MREISNLERRKYQLEHELQEKDQEIAQKDQEIAQLRAQHKKSFMSCFSCFGGNTKQ